MGTDKNYQTIKSLIISKYNKMGSCSNIIKLNVGGVQYQTTLPTLQTHPDSYFGQLFSGKFADCVNPVDEHFVDADGDMFKYILNYMRRNKLTLPDDFNQYELLSLEADFFQIQPLIHELTEMKQRHDMGRLRKKKKVLLIFDHEGCLKASYLECNTGLYELADNVTTNANSIKNSNTNRIYSNEGYVCCKTYSQLTSNDLCLILQTYGVKDTYGDKGKPPQFRPGCYQLEVWS